MTDFNNETEIENNAVTETETENKTMTETETKPDNKGVVSLILGIVSLVTSCIFLISIPAGIVGLLMGVKCKNKNGTCKAGITLSIIGLVLGVILFVVSLFIGVSRIMDSDSERVFEGEGFRLPYDYNWSEDSAETTEDSIAQSLRGLRHKSARLFITPIGYSDMPCSPSEFDDASTQKEIYDYFSDFWDDNTVGEDTVKVVRGSGGFQKLTDEIYYATYAFSITDDEIKGSFYLLVSPQKNAMLSFMVYDSEQTKKSQNQIIELLKNIEIQEPTSYVDEDSNTTFDDELYDMLDSMSPWNRHSELREGALGKKKTLEGGWRALDGSSEYWKFENGHFWNYYSIDNLDDNYWYGTTKILTGKKAFCSIAGIDEKDVDEMLESTSGQVTEDDLYAIILTPTHLISSEVSESDKDIPEASTRTHFWILIDHGSEGIEAQACNLENGEFYYFVKVND